MLYDAFLAPFADDRMLRALVGSVILALSAGPIGIFLMLRRMSLMGDALSHAILPGAAVAFVLFDSHNVAMSVGGLIAGVTVVLLAGAVSRTTELKEDASLAGFFLISLALGVAIVSAKGSDEELLHILFGNVAALDNAVLVLIAAITTTSLVALALMWRPLVLDCFDPGFLRSVSRSGGIAHLAFLALVVLNLVGAFLALGTLLAIGLMMLPAIAARFWARDLTTMVVVAALCGAISGYAGLLMSFHIGVPAGPAIILAAGAIYIVSVVFGSAGGLSRRLVLRRHLEA